ncbi:hypothetical protein [Halalkalibacter krulwichiae]|uniref:Uncharacterized protein n=1 Tax=Halalkalibacter krulwichiae TaxID=199441 RepID=A0A1X9MFY8_9BACI|nr:hypothetical protein [Halalkalibacter krulwichiae]ARK32367.1 hypothetical protein BkAM31D_22295 [Halalkalibacter krulwichiae]
MIRKVLGFRNRNVSHFTLEAINKKMAEMKFDREFAEEIMNTFKDRINEDGEKAFQKWFSELHYRLPEEFQDEFLAIKRYRQYAKWIEEEVCKLETETKLSWQQQTEDIKDLDDRARKVQLVIRSRLSDIALELR